MDKDMTVDTSLRVIARVKAKLNHVAQVREILYAWLNPLAANQGVSATSCCRAAPNQPILCSLNSGRTPQQNGRILPLRTSCPRCTDWWGFWPPSRRSVGTQPLSDVVRWDSVTSRFACTIVTWSPVVALYLAKERRPSKRSFVIHRGNTILRGHDAYHTGY